MSLHHIQPTFSLSSYSLSLERNSLLRRHYSTKRTPASLQNSTLNKLYIFFAVTCLLVTTSNLSVRRSAQPNHQPVTHTTANCRLSQYTALRANTRAYATPPLDSLLFGNTWRSFIYGIIRNIFLCITQYSRTQLYFTQ